MIDIVKRDYEECASINEHYTLEEYRRFVETHTRNKNTHQLIVYEYNGFQFNNCDVCINPEDVINYKNGIDEFRVSIAQTKEGSYCEGMYCWFVNGGHSHGPWYKETCPTKEEAIFNALKKILSSLQHAIDRVSNISIHEDEDEKKQNKSAYKRLTGPVMAELKKYLEKYDPNQLSLFSNDMFE